jgi:hypothetical protein
MTSNPVNPQTEAEDRAFAEFLRQLDLPRHSDKAIADVQRLALKALIASYDLKSADSGTAGLVAQLVADGADIDILRRDFARAAGIGDLAMLRFFSTLNAQLESGVLETIDITDLSDEELLRLFD